MKTWTRIVIATGAMTLVLAGLFSPAATAAPGVPALARHETSSVSATQTRQQPEVAPLGEECTAEILCGRVVNTSWFDTFTAIRDWCADGPCPESPTHPRMPLRPGDWTPLMEDWDGFTIPCAGVGTRNGISWYWSEGDHQIHNGEVAEVTWLFC